MIAMPKDGRPSRRECVRQQGRAAQRANHPQEFAKQLRHEVYEAAKARSKVATAAQLLERKKK